MMDAGFWGRLLGAALTTAAAGCASHHVVASPAQGGSVWHRLDTPHFTLYTDVAPDEAQATAAELEETYGLFENVAFPYNRKPTERFEVTLFQEQPTLLEIGNYTSTSRPSAFTIKHNHDPEGVPVTAYHAQAQAVQPGPSRVEIDLSPEAREFIQSDLASRFVAFYFPAAPPWLRFGLTTFYQTMDAAKGEVEVGKPPFGDLLGRMAGLAEEHILPDVAALLAEEAVYAKGGTMPIDRHEKLNASDKKVLRSVASWGLVHTMRTGQPALRAAFNDYLVAINKGEESRAAWAAALRRHGLSPANVEAEYQQVFERARNKTLEWGKEKHLVLPYNPPPAAKARTRPMAEAEVRVLWARLRPWYGKSSQKALADLDEALRADPNFAPAYAVRGAWHAAQKHHQEALVDFRKAVALDPADVRIALAFADYLDSYPEWHAETRADGDLRALVERLRQNSRSSHALAYVADYDFHRGEQARAWATLRQAIAINPACSTCYRVAARIFAGLECYDDAVTAQRRALGSSRYTDSRVDETLLDSLEQKIIERRKASPPKAPPTPGQAAGPSCKLPFLNATGDQGGSPSNSAASEPI